MLRRSSKAPVLTSPACAQTIVGASSASASSRNVDDHPALVVDGQHDLLRAADAEQAKRACQRHVALPTDDHAEGWCTGEAVRAQVVPDSIVDALPRGGERSDVGHLAASHERERAVCGEPEQLEHPTARNGLERRRRRRRCGEAGVLIPGRRKQSAAVAAGTEPPITNPKKRPEPIAVRPGSASAASSSINGVRVGAPLGHGTVDRPQHRSVVDLRADGPRVECVEPVGGEFSCAREERALVDTSRDPPASGSLEESLEARRRRRTGRSRRA